MIKEIIKLKRRLDAAFVIAEFDRALQGPNVFCLPTLLAFGHSEFNRLAFFKAAIAIALNCREVNEYIFTALTGDKAKALSGVEPLNCSLFHFNYFPDVDFDAGKSNVSAGAEEKQLAELEFLTQVHSTTPAGLSGRFVRLSKHFGISELPPQQAGSAAGPG
ncbi:MAG TPA: hypothetical protein VN679_13845 [Candidatus Acidoferrales bacterium]|nr:hypothetical protein [Candidatus Acidoferrales bacterium]